MGYVLLPVKIDKHVDHSYVVIHSLITSVILVIEFPRKHHLVLDLTSIPIGVTSSSSRGCLSSTRATVDLGSISDSLGMCSLFTMELTDKALDDCTQLHLFASTKFPIMNYLPAQSTLSPIMDEYKDWFHTLPGHTNTAEHFFLACCCQYILKTNQNQLFLLGQGWSCFISTRCHLGSQGPLPPSNSSWT